MPISIVQLGTPRRPNEGVRIGTVRRPPRGVSKNRYARDDWYDVWYPELSPMPALMAKAKASRTEAEWNEFARRFRAQMREAAPSRTLTLLAALSASANFSVGCYCDREDRCHRSVLRALLKERGAVLF